MRPTRRIAILLAATLALVGLLAAPAAASAESDFVALLNAERAARGLPTLDVYWDLTDDARAHADRMMRQDDLHHNPNLGSVTTGWEALGENVGVGPSVSVLHDAFMASSGHRANILGDWNYVGVGVVAESDTKLWVTVIFMRGPDDLLDPEPEPEPEPEPQPEPSPSPAPAPAPAPPPAASPQPAPVVHQQTVTPPAPPVEPVGRVPGLRPIAV